jgi:hypothetical protein
MLCTIGITVWLASCKDSSLISVSPDLESEVSVVSGHLRFRNMTAFTNTVRLLQKGNNYDAWESQFQGYTSMRRAYTEVSTRFSDKDFDRKELLPYQNVVMARETQGGTSFERVLCDDLLATVVSQKGILQIGDSLYLPLADQLRVVHAKNADDLSKGNANVVVRNVERVKSSQTQQPKLGARLAGNTDNYYYYEYTFDGRRHRFIANHWAENYPFYPQYWSTGLRVEHQRKQTFGWGWSNAFNWNANYDWTYYYCSGGGFYRRDASSFGAGETSEVQFYRYSEPNGTAPANFRIVSSVTWSATGRDGWPYGGSYYFDECI